MTTPLHKDEEAAVSASAVVLDCRQPSVRQEPNSCPRSSRVLARPSWTQFAGAGHWCCCQTPKRRYAEHGPSGPSEPPAIPADLRR